MTRIPDLFGALIPAIGLGALALALVKGQEWGWSGSSTLIAFAAAAVAAALAIARVLTPYVSPIVDPNSMKVRTFFWANVTVLLSAVGRVLTAGPERDLKLPPLPREGSSFSEYRF
ncbi:hypothetical protein ACFRAQ_07020 [Nocardia sp. NPDC056611]|uniref:hypothetical protein n=1 Tax=Nocardia sp. NPDC056611 TaxID=3345877 RepID=UPI00366D8EE9